MSWALGREKTDVHVRVSNFYCTLEVGRQIILTNKEKNAPKYAKQKKYCSTKIRDTYVPYK